MKSVHVCRAFLALTEIGKVYFLLITSNQVSKVRFSETCQVYARCGWESFTLENWLEFVEGTSPHLFQPRAKIACQHICAVGFQFWCTSNKMAVI